jgi:energy-coupling factor transport system ATP-binding protein
MPILIEQLNHTYLPGSPLAYPALHEVTMTVEDGEFLSVIGHTGSGKSTLVQHFNGLLLPTSGKVLVDGLDIQDKKQRKQARALVGMVFQYPEYQLFEETVLKDVSFGPKNLGLSDGEVRERALRAMTLVGLSPDLFAEKSPFDLSGGEKRRAALAGILAMEPRYLVLDEPMAGLDPKGRREILNLVEKLRKENGCTIVMVSHSMDDVAMFSTRIAVLNNGSLAMLDAPEKIFSHADALLEMGLDIPQSTQLALQLSKDGLTGVPEGICRMEELEQFLLGRWRA